MNEEAIKTYETDFQLFCSLAANSQIDADTWRGGYEVAIYHASSSAFELAANQMYFHLEQLCPAVYPFISLHHREQLIKKRINQLIKERTDHVKKT